MNYAQADSSSTAVDTANAINPRPPKHSPSNICPSHQYGLPQVGYQGGFQGLKVLGGCFYCQYIPVAYRKYLHWPCMQKLFQVPLLLTHDPPIFKYHQGFIQQRSLFRKRHRDVGTGMQETGFL